MAERYDVVTFEGDGTSRRDLAAPGVQNADLVIACTSRDEVISSPACSRVARPRARRP